MKLDLTPSGEHRWSLFSSSAEHFIVTGKVNTKGSDHGCYLHTLFTRNSYDSLINYDAFVLMY